MDQEVKLSWIRRLMIFSLGPLFSFSLAQAQVSTQVSAQVSLFQNGKARVFLVNDNVSKYDRDNIQSSFEMSLLLVLRPLLRPYGPTSSITPRSSTLLILYPSCRLPYII